MRTILVLENDEFDLQNVRRAAEDRAWTCESTDSPAKFLEMLNQPGGVDAVVVDVGLGITELGMSGLGTALLAEERLGDQFARGYLYTGAASSDVRIEASVLEDGGRWRLIEKSGPNANALFDAIEADFRESGFR